MFEPRRHPKTVGEVFGPPIGASEAASGSSTLPEVRWSDVSGPPASRSYTQGVDEQPSIEVKQLQPGSLLKARGPLKLFTKIASICTSSLWIVYHNQN